MPHSIKQSLNAIVNESDTAAGRTFDLGVQLLIVVSMIALAVETVPTISETTRNAVRIVETVTLLLFCFEYVLRLATSPRPLGYALSFFGVIDLLAILPSLVGLSTDLRAIRSLRLLRVFRILKLARYSQAIRRIHLAIQIAWEELVLFGAMTLVVLYLAAVGIYHFENPAQPDTFASIFHSLWWAVTTLTTVGYGDVYPITVGGRVFTLLVLVVGLGIVSIPPGLVASALTRARELQQQEKSAASVQSTSDADTVHPVTAYEVEEP